MLGDAGVTVVEKESIQFLDVSGHRARKISGWGGRHIIAERITG